MSTNEQLARVAEALREHSLAVYYDVGEHWLDMAQAAIAAMQPDWSGAEALRAAAQDLIDNMSSTYRARNGREVGIQGDDGEKCWIIHSDYTFALEAALKNEAPPAGESV